MAQPVDNARFNNNSGTPSVALKTQNVLTNAQCLSPLLPRLKSVTLRYLMSYFPNDQEARPRVQGMVFGSTADTISNFFPKSRAELLAETRRRIIFAPR